MSDKDFDHVFKDQLGNLSSTPSELNWIGIESQLPQSTTGQKRNIWWVAVLLLLLIGTMATFWIGSATKEAGSLQSLNVHTHQLEFDALTVSRLLAHSAPQPALPKQTYIAEAPHEGVVSSYPYRDQQITSRPTGSMPPTAVQEDLARLRLAGIDQLPHDALMVLNPVFYNEQEKLQRHAVSGFRVGPIVQAQISQHSGGSLPIDQATLFPQAGVAYGMAFHYDFNERWGLELDAMISSAEGIQLRFDQAAFSPNREQQQFTATSNYLRFPLLIKYRQPVAKQQHSNPSVWNYQLGLQYGRVNWVNLDNAANLFMPEQFNTHELGYLAGISRDWYLGKNYLFTMGARGGVSHGLTPGTAQPITWQLGLHAQLNLLLPRQAK